MMENPKEELQGLVDRLLSGQGSDQEILRFNKWFSSFQHEKDPLMSESLKIRAKQKIEDRLKQEPRKSYNFPKWSVAAAIIFIVGFAIVFYLGIRRDIIIRDTAQQVLDVSPKSNSPILIVEGQDSVLLDNEKKMVINDGNGIRYADETLMNSSQIIQNTFAVLKIPRGGEYQIVLADGTKVWLNSDTKLRYPLHFGTDKREVEIEGEAYFEVVKSKVPFIVKSRGQEIKVLGTQFNVQAYANMPVVQTTLKEGKVEVKHLVNDLAEERLILKPGEAAFSATDRLTKRKVDVEAALAWRSGLFSFDNKSFEEIMNELSRWYDIHIVYEDGVPNASFFGTAYRSSKLSFILKLLASADIQYKIAKSVDNKGVNLIISSAKERKEGRKGVQ